MVVLEIGQAVLVFPSLVLMVMSLVVELPFLQRLALFRYIPLNYEGNMALPVN